jgi:trans-aconitate methyltransferase
VTAWVATRAVAARPPRRFADLGCGIGTALMLLAWRFLTRPVSASRREASVDPARRSYGADGRCVVGTAISATRRRPAGRGSFAS